jgi:hypothetical protein
MDHSTASLEERLAKLDKDYPLVSHTNAGRLSSSVRRMNAEKEMDIPVNLRSGFVISVQTGKAANEMTESQWEAFYGQLCEQLRRDYPDLYHAIFPEAG